MEWPAIRSLLTTADPAGEATLPGLLRIPIKVVNAGCVEKRKPEGFASHCENDEPKMGISVSQKNWKNGVTEPGVAIVQVRESAQHGFRRMLMALCRSEQKIRITSISHSTQWHLP